MQIEIRTDNNTEGHEKRLAHFQTVVEGALSRFSKRITRVEVHLGDENAGKSGDADKRCMVEARPAGQAPVAVTYHASTLEEACGGAAQKLKNLLESKFGRLDDRKGGDTIGAHVRP